jgi:IclR family transcriptional regulator, acetate operon repressor
MADEIKNKKPKTTKQSSATQVQSLSRALLLLERLAASGMGMSLTEVAGSLGLAPSTAHRLLNSLRSHEFVDVDEAQGLWSIGVNAFSIGNAYLKKRDFIAQARPFMKRLVAETGETSNLAILEKSGVVYVGQVESPQTMRMVVSLGSRSPLHASGVGKALLSAMERPSAAGRRKPAGSRKPTAGGWGSSSSTLAIRVAHVPARRRPISRAAATGGTPAV